MSNVLEGISVNFVAVWKDMRKVDNRYLPASALLLFCIHVHERARFLLRHVKLAHCSGWRGRRLTDK